MKAPILAVVMSGIAIVSLRAQLPIITNQPSSRALWAGGNVTFAMGVSNAGAFACHWQFDSTNLPNGIITTVAGNGTFTSTGDGGLAVNAGINGPDDVALDPAGNMYIPDYEGHRVRKVDTNGIISWVAGNGLFTPEVNDYGPATNQTMFFPEGVALDGKGNFFIADYETSLILKVDTNNFLTAFCGNTNYIVPGYSGDGGPATNALLEFPSSVAFDVFRNLYIADGGNNRIRKVDTNGIITTVAGNGAGSFSGDGGPATNASLYQPEDAVVDAGGNLYIADYANNRVRKINTNGIITTVAGNNSMGNTGDGGQSTNATLSSPYGVAVDAAGNLLVVEQSSCVRRVDTNGIITTVAGNGTYGYSGDGGFATNASFELPTRVAADSYGNLFICDNYNCRLRKVTNTQGPALALNAVSPANAGTYQLVVTGPGGSVTSSIVNLIVATGPLIYQTMRNPDGSVALNFVSQPGSTNLVLCTPNLSPPVLWQSLSTNVAGPDGDWNFTDTNAAGSQARFYRSLQQ